MTVWCGQRRFLFTANSHMNVIKFGDKLYIMQSASVRARRRERERATETHAAVFCCDSVRFYSNKVLYVFRPKHQHYTPEKWLIVLLLRLSLYFNKFSQTKPCRRQWTRGNEDEDKRSETTRARCMNNVARSVGDGRFSTPHDLQLPSTQRTHASNGYYSLFSLLLSLCE